MSKQDMAGYNQVKNNMTRRSILTLAAVATFGVSMSMSAKSCGAEEVMKGKAKPNPNVRARRGTLAPGTKQSLNPQPLPPGTKQTLNPQPLPPGTKETLNPQPLPPGNKLEGGGGSMAR
jgi:hypothetical protein